MLREESTILTADDLDIVAIRNEFPLLRAKVYGKPVVYLDNAATTQKPEEVIKAMDDYYREYNSNVHRGVHHLSQKATDAYEVVRKKIQLYINARHEHEVIFTRGTTDGINLVAYSFGKQFVREGDSVMISAMEHHSNIVPWQLMCEERGATLKVIPINEKGELLMDEFEKLLDETVKIISVTYVSNSLGTINPVEEIIHKAHQHGIPVLLDAAQAIQHLGMDVQALDADFIVFSGHKIYGPTGIGVLYGKEEWLNQMPPYQGGGDMIKLVSFEKTTYNDLPFKFEAGTPSITETIGLGAAIDYINRIGLHKIREREEHLFQYATNALAGVDELRFVGEASHKTASISFLVGELHPFDLGEILDKQSIAIRTGHHCCQPVMNFFNIPGTARASLAFYNTEEEIDTLALGIRKAIKMLS
jgi:cysteine desulfurase/selenocysteine lyase